MMKSKQHNFPGIKPLSITTTEDCVITHIDAPGKHILGYDTSQLINTNLQNLLSSETKKVYLTAFKKIVSGKSVYTQLVIPFLFQQQEPVQLLVILLPERHHDTLKVRHVLQTAPDTQDELFYQKRFSDLVQNLNVGIYRNTPGPHGHFIEINPAMIAIFEAESRDHLLRCNVSDLYQDPEQRKNFVKKIQAHGFVKDEILKLKTLRGKLFYASITAIMKQDDEKHVFFDGILEDVTHRFELEEELKQTNQDLALKVQQSTQELLNINARLKQELIEKQQSQLNILKAQEMYRAAITQSDSIPYQKEYDPDRFVFMGEGIYELTGYTLQEINDSNWHNIIEEIIFRGELTNVPYMQAYQYAREGKVQSWRTDLKIRKKNGEIRWLSDNAIQLYDSSGKVTGSLGILQDITERKNTEATLRLRESQYRAIVEDQTELICRYRPDGTLTFLNDAFCRYFDISKDDYLGHHFHAVVSEATHQRLKEYHASLNKQHPSAVIEYSIEHPILGTRFHQWSSRVILDEQDNISEFQSVGRDITDLKRTEIALRESENKFRRLMETAAVAICIIQNDRFQYANPYFEQVSGYNLDELKEMYFWNIIHPDDRELVKNRGKLRESGASVKSRYEFRIQCKDGTTIWVDFSAGYIEYGGKPGIIGTAQDISERKKAEKDLITLSTALKQSASSIIISDNCGIIEFVNPKFCEETGYTPQEVIGKNANILKSGKMPASTYAELWQTISTGKEWHGELLNKKKNGELFWEYVSISPIRDEGCASSQFNPIHNYIAVKENITSRIKMEEALRMSEEKNRALLNAIPDTMFLISKEGVILDYKAEHSSGTVDTTEYYVGKTISEAFPAYVADQTMSYILRAFKSNHVQVYEYQLTIKQVMTDYEARVVISGEDKALVIVRNITEKKRIERMKNEFISMVSHELRTPLTSIIGTLGLLQGGVGGNLASNTKSLVDVAYRNSERLENLINDILDIEKIESGKMVFHLKVVNLQQLLKQIVKSNHFLAEKYHVNYVLIDEVNFTPLVYIDTERLTQVVVNLLSNASKFSHPDDEIVIRIENREKYHRISISDHGPGIPEDFRTHIFEKFAQADGSNTRQQGGTGLGLSICKAIIEKLGGKIGFHTQMNTGTTFYFDLPHWVESTHKTSS